MKSRDDTLYSAMLARDARFDGKFFVGVKTTGIYCRPICPAKPKRENVEFFASRLSAERAGYRPCLRCRPEAAPLSPAWNGKSATVNRALRLIAEQKHRDLDEDLFAEQLGVSARHLRRLFAEELGKTPKQIADQERLDFSRKLLVETTLPVTEIAYAAGFGSIRRFNDAFRTRFTRAPRALRKSEPKHEAGEGVELRLPFRPPFDWTWLHAYYSSHRIPGIESSDAAAYERVFRIEGSAGAVRVEPVAGKNELRARIWTEDSRHLFQIVQRLRRMFDLDSDPLLVANGFAGSMLLVKLQAQAPGLRLPRGWEPFETAIGTVLGQLVSIEQASRLMGQLVEIYGESFSHPRTGERVFSFPTPERLARESLDRVGTTSARKRTILELSRRVADGSLSLESTQDPQAFRQKLLDVPGIGPWSAEYISLRALGDTDAYPGSDLILKRVGELHRDLDLESIRPWRAYAAMQFWKEYAHALSKTKGGRVKKSDPKKAGKKS